MSVEQTSQLIQLILNSALMAIAAGIILVGLLLRHTALHLRLRDVHDSTEELMGGGVVFRGDRFTHLRHQQQYFRQRCRASFQSILFAYGALMLLLFNVLLLSLRTLLDWSWLIPGSLVLFLLGAGATLLALGAALIDFYRAQRAILRGTAKQAIPRAVSFNLKQMLSMPPRLLHSRRATNLNPAPARRAAKSAP
jgi:hypothetical protein